MQILRLIPFDKPKISNFGANQKEGGIRKKYRITGKIKKAFLYINAFVDYDRCFTEYDDFFFAIAHDNKKYYGGHIINSNAKNIPTNLKCAFLYNLNNISYISSINGNKEKNTHNNQDFLSLFTENKNIFINAFISSARPGRTMKEVSIYYQCEENSDCLIEEVKNQN